MVQSIQAQLDGFNPATAGTYDPGQVVIFFDHRSFISEKDSMSRYQSYWLQTKSRLGWPSFWYTSDLEPGKLRLVWYTVSSRLGILQKMIQNSNISQHAGAEGRREYPLHMAYTVKDMYDHLAGGAGDNAAAVTPKPATCSGTGSPRTSAAQVSPIAAEVWMP